jgi:oxygen-independent coproporphyrinogen-3 oxidase
MVGVGLTSIGELERCYAQNFKEMDEYEAMIDQGKLPFERGVVLTDDDLLRKRVIMEMMSNFKLNIPAVEKEFGIVFSEFFRDALDALKEFEDQELLSVTPTAITVSPTGMLLIRNIVMPFDAYTNIIPENRRVFSKTI